MSSISNLTSYGVASNYSGTHGTHRSQRPSAEEMASDLFSKLDSSGKGYIQQSDLETALSAVTSASSSSSSNSTSTASASEIFSQLDTNGDGKVTKDEMTSSFAKLAEELDSQFNQSRMQNASGAAGNMPPPPPQNDSGFTKDELTQQLSDIGSSDSQRSSFINNVVQNFDKADTNGDGKVTFQEAMAYNQSSSSSSSTSSSSSSSSSSSDSSSSNSSSSSSQVTDAQVFRQLMDLLRTYGTGDDATKSTVSTLVSALA